MIIVVIYKINLIKFGLLTQSIVRIEPPGNRPACPLGSHQNLYVLLSKILVWSMHNIFQKMH